MDPVGVFSPFFPATFSPGAEAPPVALPAPAAAEPALAEPAAPPTATSMASPAAAPAQPPLDRAAALEAAELAAALYRDGTIPGWRRLPTDATRAPQSDAWTGLQAGLYERAADGRVALVFAGTDPTSLLDWVNNVDQALGGYPPQYRQAAILAREAQRRFGDDVLVVGHSLGGGLATWAALKTGLRAYAFNAAGLGWRQRLELRQAGLLAAHAARITNVNVVDELLSSDPLISVPGVTPRQVGAVHTLPSVRPLTPWPPPGVDLTQPLGAGALAATAGARLWERLGEHYITAVIAALQAAPDAATNGAPPR